MIIFSELGETLLRACREVESEVILAAPFIKYATLLRLLDEVRPEIPVVCVTRWKPQEILASVSDIEIWQILRTRPTVSRLLLYPTLHAKYYRFDRTAWTGSANLTDSALGWARPGNFEILTAESSQDDSLQSFERELITSGIEVDEDLYEGVAQRIEQLRELYPSPTITEGQLNLSASDSAIGETEYYYPSLSVWRNWIPRYRHPEQLYEAYRGNVSILTTAAQEDASSDLRHLEIVPGLSRIVFQQSVGVQLLQSPIVRAVDNFCLESRRFGEMRRFLASLLTGLDADEDASHAWQTLMRWLLYFLPERYEAWETDYSEIFVRKHV